jgi:hypothetical protein
VAQRIIIERYNCIHYAIRKRKWGPAGIWIHWSHTAIHAGCTSITYLTESFLNSHHRNFNYCGLMKLISDCRKQVKEYVNEVPYNETSQSSE